MLTSYEERCIENEMVNIIRQTPGGIDTRDLISQVIKRLQSSIPLLNKRQVSGMIARVTDFYGFKFTIRTSNRSVAI